MSRFHTPLPPLLTFADADRSPLSIRARALVFVDARSRRLREDVEALAPGSVPVLIRGEMGTGKELLARHIHRGSERPGLFVAVNCGAISKAHAEAELFGHVAGTHPGSASSRAGWFGSANGGTLYLDEIGDLPLPLQAKLLAVLESREVVRVGSRQPTPVDVRLVAATSIDLAQAVRAGKFDGRLYRYLEAGALELPPLRERPGDILPLAEYFLGIYAQRLDLPLPLIGADAQAALEQYAWPGNTRELENSIHFALLVSDGEEILPRHLNLPAAAGVAVLEANLRALAADPAQRERLQRLLVALTDA
ncbi:sigma 54-interacting transcriptional regulator [Pseudomonas mangiferae]|uniref:Sigma-54-dependent Fis family transcriptional regulator n=1 Tax=Pseudomonas mangiferae TaxID=2593654 RepID=A0A553GYQ3_9PSED|nr:sigma-54-dependent transcriptional regulator [Pseudomonas mangiferae]TRX74619.1 sigma-54-dependent Fis family transcriptional regulator [Pseudomonas mangiferae]